MVFAIFAYAAIFLWNHSPNTLRSDTTYLSLMKTLQTYFFNQMFPA